MIGLHRRDQSWRTNLRILTAVPIRSQNGENQGEQFPELLLLYLSALRKAKTLEDISRNTPAVPKRAQKGENPKVPFPE